MIWNEYEKYFAAFQQRAIDATAAHFRAPLFRVADGRTTVYDTEADVRAMLTGMWAALDGKDYARSSAEGCEISELDDASALLRVWGTRYDTTGAAFQRFDVLYLLVLTDPDAAWRIAGLVSIRPQRDSA